MFSFHRRSTRDFRESALRKLDDIHALIITKAAQIMEDVAKLAADLKADIAAANAKLDVAATNTTALGNEATQNAAQIAVIEDELKTALANQAASGQVDETLFQPVRDAIAAAGTKAQGIADAAGQIATAINTPPAGQ